MAKEKLIYNMDFVPFDTAKKLKELGFDIETWHKYERNIIACRYEDYPKPTPAQVVKWLREEKKIFITVDINWHFEEEQYPSLVNYDPVFDGYYYRIISLDNLLNEFQSEDFDTYEEAELDAINSILDILIQNANKTN